MTQSATILLGTTDYRAMQRYSNTREVVEKDTGCEVHPACLECPLPQCKYDDPAGYRQWRMAKADAILADRVEQSSPTAIARDLGIGVRTIYRALNRHYRRTGKEGGTL